MSNPVLLTEENSVIVKGVLKKYTGAETSIRIPDDVHTINLTAFKKDCPVTHMLLGKAAKKVAGIPPKIISYDVDSENPYYSVIDGVLYDKKQEKLICYPIANTSPTYKVPEGIKKIAKQAFSGALYLEHVDLPNSLSSTEEHVFSSCAKLSSISFPSDYKTIANGMFWKSGLKKIQLPKGLVSIGNSAFAYTKLEEIVIPDSVVEIGDHAFNDCYDLKKITLSDAITAIPEWCFAECCSLTSISIPKNVQALGDHAFLNTGLETIDIPQGVEVIPGSCFSGCKKLKTIGIPDSVHTIDYFAFSSCEQLSVVLPSSVKEVGNIFDSCKSVEYGDNIAAKEAKKAHDKRQAELAELHEQVEKTLAEVREYKENTINRYKKLAKEITAHRQEYKQERAALEREVAKVRADVAQQQKIIQECGLALWGEKARQRKQAKEVAEQKQAQLNNLLRKQKNSSLAEHKIPENPVCVYNNCGHTVKLYGANGYDATFAIEADGVITIFNACEVELAGGSHDYRTDASELDKAIMTGIAAGAFAGYIATSAANVYTVVEDQSISIFNKETFRTTEIVFARDAKLTSEQFNAFVKDINRIMNNLVHMLDNLDPHEVAAHELIKSGNLD